AFKTDVAADGFEHVIGRRAADGNIAAHGLGAHRSPHTAHVDLGTHAADFDAALRGHADVEMRAVDVAVHAARIDDLHAREAAVVLELQPFDAIVQFAFDAHLVAVPRRDRDRPGQVLDADGAIERRVDALVD